MENNLHRSPAGHYRSNYRNFQSELYADIRREAFGEDIGQNSWLTAAEQDRFISWLALSSAHVILDVACGSGGPALRVAAKSGCSVIGVEVEEDGVGAANSLARECGMSERVRFHCVDANGQLPFPEDSFDGITCIDAINHFRDRVATISEWKRLLKPGGRLLFTDPIIVTGPLSAEEIAIRSSAGFYLFVPSDYTEKILSSYGLPLVEREDVTSNMAQVAAARHAARARRSVPLREIEGDTLFNSQQKFLEVAARLAEERRLSRFVYVCKKAA